MFQCSAPKERGPSRLAGHEDDEALVECGERESRPKCGLRGQYWAGGLWADCGGEGVLLLFFNIFRSELDWTGYGPREGPFFFFLISLLLEHLEPKNKRCVALN